MKTVAKFKPLSTKEAVLGVGRKFTDNELYEYLESTYTGKPKEAEIMKADLKHRLIKKFVSKKT